MPPTQPAKKSIALILALVLIPIVGIAFFVGTWIVLTRPERPGTVSYRQFLEDIHDGRVQEVRIRDHDVRYVVRTPSGQVVTRMTSGTSYQVSKDALVRNGKMPPPRIIIEP